MRRITSPADIVRLAGQEQPEITALTLLRMGQIMGKEAAIKEQALALGFVVLEESGTDLSSELES